MKKACFIALLAAGAALSGCKTNVGVESSANPVATYDQMAGKFYGEIGGTVPSVYKAANIALERNLGYMRTGKNDDNPNEVKIRARTRSDQLVYVTVKRGDKSNRVLVEVEVDGGDLMDSQQIFNAIAKEARGGQ